MQEEEGAPPSDQLAAPISTVRMPPLGLGSSSASAGNGFDEIAVERDSGGGSPAGNRWPRQETMALLKIRSDMDPLFQEATLKAPLWEEVSRKLAEEGYERSAKKCKEKFENVFKYYKRTKEARAGKSYRFFSQLDALRSSSSSSSVAGAGGPSLPPTIASSSAPMVNIEGSSSGAGAGAVAAPSPHTLLSVPAVRPPAGPPTIPPPRAPTDAADGGPSSSSNTSSYSGTESEDEEDGGEASRRKRKRERPEGRGSGKMMAFFQGLIKEVMDQQETMLQRFLEAIERREQNRMIREEAWRRQEKSRISREHELAAQDRAAAASRDDAIISFLQKLTGQNIPFPPPHETTVEETPPPPPPPPPRPEDPDQPPKETTLGSNSSSIRTIEPLIFSPSRWPKSQVHALINLRSGMESKYMESSIPKGPLWEEISACMGRLGYNRSAKRCKEKWENINKYYKKVKESNKTRPEDAKTCPYFHQLDALYRAKILGGSSSAAGTADQTLSTDDHQLAIISPTAAIITKHQDDRFSCFFEQAGSSSDSLVKKKTL